MMEMSRRARRMERHHQQRKRPGINLVSLMDIFTILVFFLLVSSSNVQQLPNKKDIRLPTYVASKAPQETLVIFVTREKILLTIREVEAKNQAIDLFGQQVSEPVARADRAFYATDKLKITHEIARIHRLAAGSVRAPGEAIGIPAFEMALDELAEAAGIDPLDLRLKNTVDTDPVSGLPFSSYPLANVLKTGAKVFGWRHAPPRQHRKGEWWIGQGLASAIRLHVLDWYRSRADTHSRARS